MNKFFTKWKAFFCGSDDLTHEEVKRYFNFTLSNLSSILIIISLIIILNSFLAALFLGLGIYLVIFTIFSNEYYNFMIFYSLRSIEKNTLNTDKKINALQKAIARKNRRNSFRKRR
ncbi:hypothetical protein A2331_00955 [Candidatus Falkowbacteria bacterium RIFOXYB2_FULL_34_18]|uniref:Uncharacterized protein n=1 Tax=Candidatus Falkowbacteria bacterium RIFOXYD2_FULL_34_120 TaxID=1798007 RepID=A0A1F5TSI2_9BACT|nr:MAG: hypothetical protein A2331_00955 [Candidatus Falkowbacteria bacterium RIFOXYB2_FULL_34_18]OGF30185.1 MAG: hypothetical protein A2500_02155 [Candidatus Falkowbacteria bacterium RIFOXYC12_FULL_34_55]OGF37666.1 MAG: hypothetical protein A2466_05510 [Candidatus Falkowbacteria bacterium RIFOXYC2_FULL_34_220]OGF39393.1 MAG: hypothetical protein A2515_02740 [Candidatus Falkowbacteria bacterium RIFOXYD12_FULL_34_57]OGF41922.1 MAG: hypothetical protein A2531_04805 [Candidatus Falkowbacteria bact